MSLIINDQMTEKLARDLARQTGEDVATAMRRALEERLRRISNPAKPKPSLDSLAEIRLRWAALPDIDRRNANDIIGYDENGLPD